MTFFIAKERMDNRICWNIFVKCLRLNTSVLKYFVMQYLALDLYQLQDCGTIESLEHEYMVRGCLVGSKAADQLNREMAESGWCIRQLDVGLTWLRAILFNFIIIIIFFF